MANPYYPPPDPHHTRIATALLDTLYTDVMAQPHRTLDPIPVTYTVLGKGQTPFHVQIRLALTGEELDYPLGHAFLDRVIVQM